MSVGGRVVDQYGQGVAHARLEFTAMDDATKVYVVYSDDDGSYSVGLPVLTSGSQECPELFGFYPNPFSVSVSGWIHLSAPAYVQVRVISLAGKTVRFLMQGEVPPGLYEISWDGRNERGSPMAPGVYFIHTVAGNLVQTNRVVYHPSASTGYPAGWFLNRPVERDPVYYRVEITGEDIRDFRADSVRFDEQDSCDFTVQRIVLAPFAAVGEEIGIWNGAGYDPVFLRGVNLGATVPGTFPGELAITREQYRNWLERMAQAGFNAVRIYTLHYPRFYEELLAYNLAHPEKPLYLIQGVWLNEEVPGLDFYNLTGEFDQEICEVVDCVHGNGDIPVRYGKAYGEFTADVSEWVLAYIIGREIHPDEVLTTDAAHDNPASFSGEAFSLPSGSPTEAWITARMNRVVVYERNTYFTQRPVSFSSWPTMDPLDHPTELPTETQEDVASFDMTRVVPVEAPAGLFVSYHAYPYYPDFISEDPEYQTFSDASGPNSYPGYLNDLREHYKGLPLVIAEYGVPSSWGNAHFSYSGMDHGHHDEETQGQYFVRQLDNIFSSGAAGAILFSWTDEWFKNTWITEPFDSDPWRRPFWQNITGPEQNFGLLGFDPEPPDFDLWPDVNGGCGISRVETAVSRSFFHIRIEFSTALQLTDLIRIAFDTYRSDLGESILPGGEVLINRAEFYLEMDFSGYAQLFVTEAYDLFGIWHGVSGPEQLFHSVPSDGSPWMPVRWKNNRYEEAVHQVGALQTTVGNGFSSSLDAAYVDGNTVEIRIPWSLLQFTDPLCREVMDDDRSTPEREVTSSDGIALTLFYNGCRVETPRFLWEEMDPFPVVTEREKACFETVKQALQGFSVR